MEEALDRKMRELEDNIRSSGRAAIAFSSGVDSTLVLAVAKKVLGDDVLAITVSTELQTPHEIEMARESAQRIGVRHLVIRLQLLDNPQISSNPRDRCYLCKRSMLAAIVRSAKEKGFAILMDGTNLDDAGSDRPGLKALRELGVKSPLVEARMTKDDVRAASTLLGLPTKDKPSNPCLATRVPFDSPLTVEKLRMIDRAESGLVALGFKDSRVRHHGTIARIEVPVSRFNEVLRDRERIVNLIREAGFVYAVLDLQGYRSGSMEEPFRSDEHPDLE